MKKIFWITGAILLAAALLLGYGGAPVGKAGSDYDPTPLPPEVEQARRAGIEQALQAAVMRNQVNSLALVVYDVVIDHIDYASDGTTALVWLALVERETGRQLATEPELAIANRLDASLDGAEQWEVILRGDAIWEETFARLPAEYQEREYIQVFARSPDKEVEASTQVFSGFRLPWAGGLGKYLEGSIAHFLIYFSCSETACRYAYDFADGTMFPLLAARGGTVWSFKDTCANYDPYCSNYLVLLDQSTVPATYTLYLHLAKNSIPAALKRVGAPVLQGQYIGNVDDTGYSTGHHLHFHVYTTPTPGSAYWGNSVDITFDDVLVNGGRPRTWYEATRYPQYGTGWVTNDWYVSGNQGAFPPSGGLTAPLGYTTVTSPLVTFSGWGTDDIAVTRFQVIASYDEGNNWVPVGPSQTANPFTATIDLCSANIPNGPVLLALRIWDYEGNLAPGYPGLRPIIKDAECLPPPPDCLPASNQVTVYTGINYTGTCRTYATGNYDWLNSLVSDLIQSIQVGSNVAAVMYDTQNYGDRPETWAASDSNLADNRLGAERTSSMRVVNKTSPPDAPVLQPPRNSLADTNPNSSESLILTWKGGDRATEFNASLSGPGGSRSSGWQRDTAWSVGSLSPGDYTWTVIARNSAGQAQSSLNFTVDGGLLPDIAPKALNWSDNMESGPGDWTPDGLWRLASITVSGQTTGAWVFNGGSNYAHSSIRAGNLTTPPLVIPAGGAVLTFKSYADLGDRHANWDQRRVQVAPVGGNFVDVYQFDDDLLKAWRGSPVIDLTPYAGQTIRIRFHFAIVDDLYNNSFGWAIDDILVTTSKPDMSCVEAPPGNDTPATAAAIAMNSSVDGVICLAGDVDYYKFTANVGDYIYADIDAQSIGSALDSYLFLLDADGTSVITKNDDRSGTELDSKLEWRIPASGTYYLKIRSAFHPGLGGSTHFYRLNLKKDSQPPTAAITFPFGAWIPVNPFTMTASASDGVEGDVARVEFYWHSTNWSSDRWVLLGSDTNGADGWSVNVNPAALGSLPGSTLYVKAVDKAGRSADKAWWNLALENTPPVVTMQPLNSPSQSTAVWLSWSASDDRSGVASLDLQTNTGSGWTNWQTGMAPTVTGMWYLGSPGASVGFRMRGTDRANNVGTYPTSAQASTALPTTCTPDAFEDGDDTANGATILPLGVVQEHNLCATADTDWVKVNLTAGEEYMVRTASVSGGAAVNITIFAADGTTVILDKPAGGVGFGNVFKFAPAAGGEYYLRLTPVNTNLMGTQARYSILVAKGYWIYVPLIGK